MNFHQSVVHIGSDPGNDFQLTDPEISEYHGRFTCNHEASHYAYCDLQSEHGTRVRSSTVDVRLFSQQLAQSVALAGECMLFLGQSMVRCTYAFGPSENAERQVRQIKSVSMRTLEMSDDVEMLSFLLETATALTTKTTHQPVMSYLTLTLLQRLPQVTHIAIWRHDSFRDSFLCLYERTRQYRTSPSMLGDNAFREAIRTQNASLYGLINEAGQDGCGCAVIVPLVTPKQELGVILAESNDPDGIDSHAFDLLVRVSCVAASALERTFINADLSSVFDGFIRSIIAVMDARDPASAGHSMRVAKYALYTAQAIQNSQEPAFKNITFSNNHLDELRFASMLHDIGKVVLRREILLKSAKLLPNELQHLLERIDLFEAWFSSQPPEKRAENYPTPRRFELYREMVTRVVQAQQKATPADRELIDEMGRTFIPPCPGLPLLKPQEIESLLIERGTLNKDELKEIQRHALISWQYLTQIAWPQRWANVPIFVLQHHEKLNGTGYPYGISGDQIFIQSRIITICDIFDALTGGDRLYKTRHSFGEAAEILLAEAKSGALDSDIVDLFIERVIPQIADPELAD
ncbi:MAG: FHA domain-containing protein [Proteobacteria bacterium]|nr:FHA domain-containing protein [Pseudomonadota bacterium]